MTKHITPISRKGPLHFLTEYTKGNVLPFPYQLGMRFSGRFRKEAGKKLVHKQSIHEFPDKQNKLSKYIAEGSMINSFKWRLDKYPTSGAAT